MKKIKSHVKDKHKNFTQKQRKMTKRGKILKGKIIFLKGGNIYVHDKSIPIQG